ncbi:transposable element Tcb2 transposase [Trichonephila clavipes]|nr:transposable element Tcb2 transposase [Trichonephila clavipes]
MSFIQRPGSGRHLKTSRREEHHISGATHEETGLQRNGTRSSLAMNPDSISGIMTIVFLCGDSVVNASIMHLLYSDTPLLQLVMVWGAISYNTRSPLILIRGTMTAQRYVHDILQPHVLPLIQRLPGAFFLQDNARLHTARVSQDSPHCYYPSLACPIPIFVSN